MYRFTGFCLKIFACCDTIHRSYIYKATIKKVVCGEYSQRAGEGVSPAAVAIDENHFGAAGRDHFGVRLCRALPL